MVKVDLISSALGWVANDISHYLWDAQHEPVCCGFLSESLAVCGHRCIFDHLEKICILW